MDKKLYAQRVRIKMMEKGLKSKTLAEKLGIKYMTFLSHISADRTAMPAPKDLMALARELDTTVGYLIGEDKIEMVEEPAAKYGGLTESQILRILWKNTFNEDFKTDKQHITTKLKSLNLI